MLKLIDIKKEYNTADIKVEALKGINLEFRDSEFVSITAFNTAEDFANMLGADKDAYKQYENVKVGGCIDWGESDGSTSQILRIW